VSDALEVLWLLLALALSPPRRVVADAGQDGDEGE
jgi:hypothetical protein